MIFSGSRIIFLRVVRGGFTIIMSLILPLHTKIPIVMPRLQNVQKNEYVHVFHPYIIVDFELLYFDSYR